MSDTQALLGRIAALRQRLEEARGEWQPGAGGEPLVALARLVARGAEDNAALDATLRQLPDTTAPGEGEVLPTRLTARARRVLERGRELLGRLRRLADGLDAGPADDPLARHYRATTAMANTSLRMLQALPDAASVQLRLCEGIEVVLGVIAQRVALLAVLADQRRREAGQVDGLAELLADLAAERPVDIKPFVPLAEAVLTGARQSAPLRFVHADPDQPARFVACHSWNVAQVVARLVRHDPDLKGRPLEPVLAALVHDVGMLRVPAAVLAHPGPLGSEERRAVEGHCQIGAGLTARLLPTGNWLAEAAEGHHERLDGTGYPDGLRELQIPALTRLLAVCDIYAALCASRPHRPAQETRAALADTLLLAEQGALDRLQAERLLQQLSFYPPGTVVELAEGEVAVVLAVHPTYRDLNVPTRPALALLTDAQGRPLPTPRPVDLAQCEGHSIVRTLTPEERRQLLGERYPEYV